MQTGTSTLQNRLDAVLRWDTAALLAVRRFERRSVRVAMRALTRAGDTPGWIVHGLVLLALLPSGAGDAAPSASASTGAAWMVATMTVAALLATATSQAAKRLFRRTRPDLAIAGFVARDPNPDPFSFPSGHSTVAFAIATAALAASPVLGTMEGLLASGIACSRVYLGAHYPVDVLAGIALGIACGVATVLLMG
jgi:undecaprenyl-diphosphatase